MNLKTRTKNPKLRTIFIVGPTASGKTALSLDVAEMLGGEIICADSQTVRREMDIGTAKPTRQERARVPHHLIDVIDPYEGYSLDRFLKDARAAMDDIHARGKMAIIVGGSGLYADALHRQFEPVEPLEDVSAYNDMTIDELKAEITRRGYLMPLNHQNRRHLVNTLVRGGLVGGQRGALEGSVIVGIAPPRGVLIERIGARVEAMFDAGFVDEVRQLIRKWGEPPRELDAIGYRIVYRHLHGEFSLDEAKERFKIADCQYAKRQMAWFKRNPYIVWFSEPAEAKEYVVSQ